MSTEALRKAVERINDSEAVTATPHPDCNALIKMIDVDDWHTVRQALRDQEAEIARLQSDCDLRFQQAMKNGQAAQQAESALATHRANYDALVIRLGEVTTRLEAADGLLRELLPCIENFPGMPTSDYAELHALITTHLKAADHV